MVHEKGSWKTVHSLLCKNVETTGLRQVCQVLTSLCCGSLNSEAGFLRTFLCTEKFWNFYLRACLNLMCVLQKGEDKMTSVSFLEDVTEDDFVLLRWRRLTHLRYVLVSLLACPRAESNSFCLCLDSVLCTGLVPKGKFSGIFKMGRSLCLERSGNS